MKVTWVLQAYELDGALGMLGNYKTYNSEGLSKLSKRANELCSTTKDNDPECSNDSSRITSDRQGAIDNESNCRFVP